MHRFHSALKAAILTACLIGVQATLRGDGTETLGPPSIAIQAGTDLIGVGAGLGVVQPESRNLPVIPAGATIQQVLLYWNGFHHNGPGDNTLEFSANGSATTSVNGTLIGGPTTFFNVRINNVWTPVRSSSYRADITNLALITTGANSVTFGGLDFAFANNGASCIVIYDDNVSPPSEIAIRDGQDLAFINFLGALKVTVPQTFSFTPSAQARSAQITLLAGSVEGPLSGSDPTRPNAVRVTTGGQVTTFVDPFFSSSGDEWDHTVINVVVPAGANSLTVQAFSESDGSQELPASFAWIGTAMAIQPPIGEIGDYVWCDDNNDGVQDPTEPGIPGVTVSLRCAGTDGMLNTADDLLDSTVTDAGGLYLFTGISPGLCQVTVDASTALPKIPGSNCPLQYMVNLGAGQSFLDADFCFRTPPGQIGDLVWCDLNKNSVFDIGEPGIAGVTVNLRCAGLDGILNTADDVLESTVTNGQGAYLFLDVEPATCLVTVDAATAPAGCGVPCIPGQAFTVNLMPAQSFLDADFCFQSQPGEIGDLVWCDENMNGLFDVGEPGLAGVTVNLRCAGPDGILNTADDLLQSMATDAAGAYLFTGIDPQTCVVTVNAATAPADCAVPCIPNQSFTVTLQAGQSFLDADFCFRGEPGEIGDFVWCDLNKNGLFDVGEAGLAGVTVDLRCEGPDGLLNTADDVLSSTMTNAMGFYLFTDIDPDTCEVTVDAATAPAACDVPCIPDQAILVPLQPGQSFLDADFCFQRAPGEIGDFVWCDDNQNGLFDVGEMGIAGVTVVLRCAGPDGILNTADDIMDSQVTNLAGAYLFTDIDPQTCVVTVDASTAPVDCSSPCIPNLTYTVTLQPGQSFLDADFCFQDEPGPPGQIGDFVWCDLNQNGLFDAGEPGISGVTVDLRCAGADGLLNTADDLLQSQATNVAGAYLFTGIDPQECVVTVDAASAPADCNVPCVPGQTFPIDLQSGQSFLDADFCFQRAPGEIGDLVWCDDNKNGVFDVGEMGIAGVTVILRCAGPDEILHTADDTVQSTVTDAAGAYLFTDVDPQLCAVTVDEATAPADCGVPCIPNQTFKLNVQPGQSYLDADFCFQDAPGEIGDFVWCDLNQNGLFDAGEPGLQGVVVDLRCAGPDGLLNTADDVTQAALTNAAGAYLFTGIDPDTCVVTVFGGSVPADCNVPCIPNQSYTVPVQSGQSFLDADFCFQRAPGEIGDLVWCDENSNGLFDVGELGLSGVTVNLRCAGADGVLNTADDLLQSQVTNALGAYLFTGIDPQTCVVTVSQATAPADCSVPCIPNQSFTVTLQSGQSFLDADFCFQRQPGEIGDFVWCDLNNNGLFEVGEPGLAGVTVNLRCAGPDGVLNTADDLLQSQATSMSGAYLFTGIDPDTCEVTVSEATAPAGCDVPCIPGQTLPVTVQPGQSFLDADFCFQREPGEIGDLVWCDENKNGQFDAGEPGLAGVTVNLRCAGPDGVLNNADDLLQSQVTDAAGAYLFTGIDPQTCVVTVDAASAPADCGMPCIPNQSFTVTLQGGQSFLDADFCFRRPPASIGDFVWCDDDDDGVQDPSEPGIPGVTVNLRCAGPDGLLNTADDFLDSQVTNGNGFYLFSDLDPGECTVAADPVTAQPKLPGSNCPPSHTVVLQPNQVYLDADFCFINQPGRIGDFVWCDDNNNGLQDPGEPGIPGVAVVLLCAGIDGVLGTADDLMRTEVTDADGLYMFEDVPPGSCSVSVQVATALPKTPGVCPLTVPVTLAAGESYLDADFCFVGVCAPCSGRITQLTLRYLGGVTNANIVVIGGNGQTIFSGVVQPNGVFSFNGSDSNGTMGTEIDITVNGGPVTSIHTSCSQPIGPGSIFGLFEVVAGASLNGGPLCPLGPCDGAKPCGLTMRYTGQSCAATQHNQDPSKVSCTGDPMLEALVLIRASDKASPTDGNANVYFLGEVALGALFEINSQNAGQSKLAKETFIHVFDLGGTLLQTVKFHTSCSQPLNLGNQFGSVRLEGFTAEGDCPCIDICCDGKPCLIQLEYTGESCAATSHAQDPSKVSCTGDPQLAMSVVIRVSNKANASDSSAKVWFQGPVMLGESFAMEAANGGDTKFGSDSFAHIFTPGPNGTLGTLLQSIRFHTSCSQPIRIDDQFGALKIVDFVPEGECMTAGGADFCDNGGKPAQLHMTYTGSSCAASQHSQSGSAFSCTGDPLNAMQVLICATDSATASCSSGNVWFQGTVMLGEPFTIDAANANRTRLSTNTYVHVFTTNGTLLQSVKFHTSCSQPLLAGDQFGSVRLDDLVLE